MAGDRTIGGPWPQARFVSVNVWISEDSISEGQIDRATPMLVVEQATENCRWVATIELTTGRILNWPPSDSSFSMRVVVKNSGTYVLFDSDRRALVRITNSYVPREIFPGGNEDYLTLDIGRDGKITNWPRVIDTWDFDVEELGAEPASADGLFAERPTPPRYLALHENPYAELLSMTEPSPEKRRRLRILERRLRMAQDQHRKAIEEWRQSFD